MTALDCHGDELKQKVMRSSVSLEPNLYFNFFQLSNVFLKLLSNRLTPRSRKLSFVLDLFSQNLNM
jgi:hypothetical protein